jgi:hypothetical protein
MRLEHPVRQQKYEGIKVVPPSTAVFERALLTPKSPTTLRRRDLY